MNLRILLTTLALPLIFSSCGLLRSALKVPSSLIQSGIRTVTDAEGTAPQAPEFEEQAAAIALKH